MTHNIDTQYIRLLGSQLGLFKEKGNKVWNFRCPCCGDSQKSKIKARGYVFQKKNDLFYKCHNCGVGMTLGNLIKHVDPNLHKEYIMERYKANTPNNNEKPKFEFKKPVFKTNTEPLKFLKNFVELGEEHPATQLLQKRMLPTQFYNDLYFTDGFFEYVNTLIPNKFPTITGDHPRLVIPFFDENKKMFGLQGRSFGSEKPKYITIMLEDKPKVFGLDRINLKEKVYIVEGPLDSLFIDNCLAMAGSDMILDIKDSTIIFDNEPRNLEIIKKMSDTIDKGKQIVIWPDSIKEKDINDMIVNGMTVDEIHDIISNNTFSNLHAKTRLINWKKI